MARKYSAAQLRASVSGIIAAAGSTPQEAKTVADNLVLATASGEHSKSEQHGYGQNEFVPWQVGAVM